MTGQHHIIKETSESFGQMLQGAFKDAGYKRVHMVVAAPKQEAIEGKLPAVSVYLYNIELDHEGYANNRSELYFENVLQPDGSIQEVARPGALWVRLDYILSTWAQTPEEEQLLMGVAIKTILQTPVMNGDQLKGDSLAVVKDIPLQLSQRLDEGVLSRFWASLNQPLKPAVQCWTTIPIIPDAMGEIKRVVEREVRFFDLNKVNKVRR